MQFVVDGAEIVIQPASFHDHRPMGIVGGQYDRTGKETCWGHRCVLFGLRRRFLRDELFLARAAGGESVREGADEATQGALYIQTDRCAFVYN